MKKAVILLSDGIDSPVAAYLMKNKLILLALHFVNTKDKNISKIKKLSKKTGIKKLYLINNYKNQKELLKCNRRFHCVLCKRLMYRIAEQIAKKEKAEFIITGENLAQVASQTLENLYVLTKAVKIPVIRPLLCFDKDETIKIAKDMGTYDISIKNQHKCDFVPKNPLTKAKINKVIEEEKKIDIKRIVNNSLKSVKILKIKCQ